VYNIAPPLQRWPKNLKKIIVTSIVFSLSFSPLVQAQVVEAPTEEPTVEATETEQIEVVAVETQ
jgi:hypothetical protein